MNENVSSLHCWMNGHCSCLLQCTIKLCLICNVKCSNHSAWRIFIPWREKELPIDHLIWRKELDCNVTNLWIYSYNPRDWFGYQNMVSNQYVYHIYISLYLIISLESCLVIELLLNSGRFIRFDISFLRLKDLISRMFGIMIH